MTPRPLRPLYAPRLPSAVLVASLATLFASMFVSVGCKARKYNERTASGVKGVYGADDRKDMGDADARWQALGRGVALVPSSGVAPSPNGDVVLKASPLKDVVGLCDDVRFAQQPSLGKGTAFLLSDSLVLTASHVVSQCKGAMFLFDQRQDQLVDQGGGSFLIPKDSVYGCGEIVSQGRRASVDFSLVRLDRPTSGRGAFRVTQTTPPAQGERVVLFGHPSGLPLKFTDNATVLSDDNATTFRSDLDAFGGNSGGPVVAEASGALLGVLTGGNVDYVDKGRGCKDIADSQPSVGETAMSLGLVLPYFGEALPELGLADAKDFEVDLSAVDFSAENAALERTFDVPDMASLVGFDLVLDGTHASGLFCAHSKVTPPGGVEKRADWRNAAIDTLAPDGKARAQPQYVLSGQFDFPRDLFGTSPQGTWKVTLARECKGLNMTLRKLTLRLYVKK